MPSALLDSQLATLEPPGPDENTLRVDLGPKRPSSPRDHQPAPVASRRGVNPPRCGPDGSAEWSDDRRGTGRQIGCDGGYLRPVIALRSAGPADTGTTDVVRPPRPPSRPVGARYAHVHRHLSHGRQAPCQRAGPHPHRCRRPAGRNLRRRVRARPHAGRRPRLVQARGVLRGAGPGVQRLQPRRHRRPARADRRSWTTSSGSASTACGCRRSTTRRCATAATTSATSARCCPSSAPSTTSSCCSTRRTSAASG